MFKVQRPSLGSESTLKDSMFRVEGLGFRNVRRPSMAIKLRKAAMVQMGICPKQVCDMGNP